MQLQELELYSQFRGLQPGFKITFTRPAKKVNKIEPLCFAGLNGSGKSNAMQAIAQIFFYLETCVLQEAQGYIEKATSFGFSIQYIIPVNPGNFIRSSDDENYLRGARVLRYITITKKIDQEPTFRYYYDPAKEFEATEQETQTLLLPEFVVGYSSGMNELLSNPFIKMDFFYLDMFKEKLRRADQGETTMLTVSRLFFLDYQSNALALISNFMMKEDLHQRPTRTGRHELDIINSIVGIDDIVSFRILLNLRIRKDYKIDQLREMLWEYVTMAEVRRNVPMNELRNFSIDSFLKYIDLPGELAGFCQSLIDCSTTVIENSLEEDNNKKWLSLELHYCVDAEMKRAFQDKIRGDAMGMFEKLYLLNLLNLEAYSDELRERIKRADFTMNIHELLPKVSAEEKVFHVDSIKLRKKNKKTLYYQQLSDGEHQYLQVAGSLLLMKRNVSLFLLDEPETHFNPEWRSRLISTLNEIRKTQLENDPDYEETDPDRQLPMQDVLLTSHSPFIISDCEKDNVYIFYRDPEKGVQFRKPQINTYGTSADLIMDEVFSKYETISEMSFKEIENLKLNLNTLNDIQEAKQRSKRLGESVEKVFLFNYFIEKEKELKADADSI